MRWALLVVALAGVAHANEKRTDRSHVIESLAAKASSKSLGELAVTPTAYTDDPVVGRASRITGLEAPGMIAFTFDDGPSPETTPAVLDALAKYDVPATFFVVTRRLAGKRGAKSRELLARTLADGHLVASHSVSHSNLGQASDALLDKEMDASFRSLAQHAKRPIALFRAPYGKMNPAARTRLKKLGVTEAHWSIDTLDWQVKDPVKLRKRAIEMIEKKNGGVILWHDAKRVTANVIAHVLDDLEAANCKRLAENREPIWPVSIHYFLRDGKQPRPVPEEVAKRTEAYKAALPGRCAKRPPSPAAPATTP